MCLAHSNKHTVTLAVLILIKVGQSSTLKRGKEGTGMVIWAMVHVQNVQAASRYYCYAFRDFSSQGNSETEPALTSARI